MDGDAPASLGINNVNSFPYGRGCVWIGHKITTIARAMENRVGRSKAGGDDNGDWTMIYGGRERWLDGAA